MPITNKITAVLDSFTDTEMELLIRRYIRRMDGRMKPGTPIHFHIESTAYDAETKSGIWEVGNTYKAAYTRGAVLAEVVSEQNRRSGFKSTILQITDESTDIDGEGVDCEIAE